MVEQAIIVLDCGATNLRAVAISTGGKILASAAYHNQTVISDIHADWHTWSLQNILASLQVCCQSVVAQLHHIEIVGLTVTTFGVDGSLVDEQGQLLYPIISWKCPRTLAAVSYVESRFSQQWLQEKTGVGFFGFNTLYKLAWLKQHQAACYQKARGWLFISSLITHHLTGELTTDRTMAGTSQLFDLETNQFNTALLDFLEIDACFFPRLVNAGETIGALQPAVATAWHLPVNLRVISAGHDTQFALFGSGAGINQPVLSSGTWEILMIRTAGIALGQLARIPNSTCELDANTGLRNPGIQWLASGVVEQIKALLWDYSTPYEDILAKVAEVPIGSEGIDVNPDFLIGSHKKAQGAITGLSLNASKAAIFRATLEGLSSTLKRQFETLCRISHCQADALILVGGGSKNRLWNQIKADTLNIPIKIPQISEMTVMGAAMYGLSGAQVFPSPESVRDYFNIQYDLIYPDPVQVAAYQAL